MFTAVQPATRGSADALVVGQFKGQQLDPETKTLDPDGTVLAASKRAEATGEAGSVVEAFPGDGYARVLIVGLGDKSSFEPGVLRDAAAGAGRALSRAQVGSAEIALGAALGRLAKSSRVSEHAAGSMVGEALGLLAWHYDELRGSATESPDRPTLRVHGPKAFMGGVRRGLGMAEGANLTRRLSQTPPNIATPMWIASEARKLARKSGLSCTVVKGKKLEDERLTGHINVGKASENEPCFIRLQYTPGSGKTKRPIVLIGKMITYDTGGLSIKPSAGMKGMKRDKDGGCAVLGAMHAIAEVIKPNRPVVALLACAENSISDAAYRPDDVIEFRNGVTVEVTNTDAEGRLVMADALCWACDKEDPEFIIDTATLTGGVVVALGSVHAGLWSNDDELASRVGAASDASGERTWRLPLHAEYRAMMKSPVADIVNSAPVREAHPIQAAAFLEHFVADGVKWAHLDIAGMHETDKDRGAITPGPTGFGARLLAELAERG